ncbi:hypothetical protein TNCV_3395431 [Trichonephila clavipes]|nr:hypothetical protein TNCV_3395431 [Trichonephila clavipes]
MGRTPDKIVRQSNHKKDLCGRIIWYSKKKTKTQVNLSRLHRKVRPRTGQPGMKFLIRPKRNVGCRAIEEGKKKEIP